MSPIKRAGLLVALVLCCLGPNLQAFAASGSRNVTLQIARTDKWLDTRGKVSEGAIYQNEDFIWIKGRNQDECGIPTKGMGLEKQEQVFTRLTDLFEGRIFCRIRKSTGFAHTVEVNGTDANGDKVYMMLILD